MVRQLSLGKETFSLNGNKPLNESLQVGSVEDAETTCMEFTYLVAQSKVGCKKWFDGEKQTKADV